MPKYKIIDKVNYFILDNYLTLSIIIIVNLIKAKTKHNNRFNNSINN
jgi:hypothetical protein